jgi:hypothetical protein
MAKNKQIKKEQLIKSIQYTRILKTIQKYYKNDTNISEYFFISIN